MEPNIEPKMGLSLGQNIENESRLFLRSRTKIPGGNGCTTTKVPFAVRTLTPSSQSTNTLEPLRPEILNPVKPHFEPDDDAALGAEFTGSALVGIDGKDAPSKPGNWKPGTAEGAWKPPLLPAPTAAPAPVPKPGNPTLGKMLGNCP